MEPVGVVDRPVLADGVVVLRAPRASDQAERQGCGSHPDIARMLGVDLEAPRPMSDRQADEWFQRLLADPLAWVIEARKRCVGEARLHSLVRRDRRARYAIGLYHPDFLGHGTGTTATRLVLAYAFGELRMHRVDLRVLAYNTRAIACYRRCGFVEEGVERESAWVNGAWHDDVMMSVLEPEYRARDVQGLHADGT
jgi:RimJ/RimL family protein N-acetyltransferase